MNTNMTGFRWFSKSLRPCALDEISLSIRSFIVYIMDIDTLIAYKMCIICVVGASKCQGEHPGE